jgi:hypothetical protein
MACSRDSFTFFCPWRREEQLKYPKAYSGCKPIDKNNTNILLNKSVCYIFSGYESH